MSSIWSPAERLAWRPPEQMRPSQWAEKYRLLTRRQSSRPGPWRNENAPALTVLMDLCVRRAVNEIWVKKAAQIGASEAIRNVIGFLARQRPDPILIVFPNEKDGRKIVQKRLIPLFDDTPVLAELSTGSTRDKKLTQITLANGFDLQLGWAGSASSLASDPFRTVFLDEVDKYESFAGREANPVDLARVRTRTYGDDGLLVALSTPTIAAGPISQGFESCPIKLYCYVPCPHCRAYQRLVFDRLKWEKFKDLGEATARAARIRDQRAAWYECANPRCGKRIVEQHKRRSFNAGYWATEDGGWKLFVDGREQGRKPEGNRVGMHLPALYDLSTPFHEIAADFVEAEGKPDKLMHLFNSTLAEEFKEQVAAVTTDVFAAKCRPNAEDGFTPPAGKVIPRWASRLLMTVDTQKDHFYFVIRAWGHGMRSVRIHHGRATSFSELSEIFYHAYFPYEGAAFPPTRCYVMGIDSGGGKYDVDASRTDDVYRFCLRDAVWLLPLKGTGKSFDERIRKRQITYTPPNAKREPYQVWLHLLDVGYFQDLLSSYVVGEIPTVDVETGEVGEPVPQWMLNDRDDPEYNRHLANMIKERVKVGRSYVERWRPKTTGARVDFRDCEVYQVAMAHGPGRCFALPSPHQIDEQIRQRQQGASLTKSRPLTDPHGRPFLATQRDP